MLLLILLFVPASADPPVVNVIFTLGWSTTIAGTPVQMLCQISNVFNPLNYTWYYQRCPTMRQQLAATCQNLTLQHPVVEDSGNYTCSVTTKNETYTKTVALAVIEKLSSLSVVVIHQQASVWDGGRVTLRCVATSEPPEVDWSWERLDQGHPVTVGSEQELKLYSPAESGEYRCLGCSSIQGILQKETSDNHSVLCVNWQQSPAITTYFSMTVASLVLGLLAWVVLLMVAAKLCLQSARVKMALSPAAVHASTAGLSGPGSTSKMAQKKAGCEDVYTNHSARGQSYSDLNLSDMTGNIYDNLS